MYRPENQGPSKDFWKLFGSSPQKSRFPPRNRARVDKPPEFPYNGSGNSKEGGVFPHEYCADASRAAAACAWDRDSQAVSDGVRQAVVAYTMEAFQRHPDIDVIAMVCVEGWESVLRAYAREYGITKRATWSPAANNGQSQHPKRHYGAGKALRTRRSGVHPRRRAAHGVARRSSPGASPPRASAEAPSWSSRVRKRCWRRAIRCRRWACSRATT